MIQPGTMRFGARAYSPQGARRVAEAGFDFVEIDWKDPRALRAQWSELEEVQDRYAVVYLAHGPSEQNPFDIAQIVDELGPLVCKLLLLAQRAGIALYTQHLWLDPRFVSDGVIAHKLDLLETWLEVAQRAGVVFCIENLSEHADHFAPAFRRMPALAMTLDLGHGEILSEPNAAFGFVARFPERIRHVHLHDNHGGKGVKDDLHLPVGEGRVDFQGVLRALQGAGYAGGFSFEVDLEHAVAGREAISSLLPPS
jgi:sugar phosphate isomerase/epimerase